MPYNEFRKTFDKDKDIINNIKSNKIFNKEKNCYIDKIVEKYSKEFLDLIDEIMTYEPSKRPSIEDILEKDIIKTRMFLYLKENEFNKDEATKAINSYINKFGSIEKEEESTLIKNEETDDNLDSLDTSYASCPLKEEKKKYDLARQLSLIHDYLQKCKTYSPKEKD